MQHISPTVETIPHSDRRLLGFGIGIPVVAFLLFVLYWFRIRDHWEVDNYLAVGERCDAVMYSIRQSNDEAAAQAFADLKEFVGQHAFKDEWLASRVKEVHAAFAPVAERIEQVRQEAADLELAEAKRREAEAEAKRHEQQARLAEMATSPSEERYYRDSDGVLYSETETEDKLWEIRKKISSMPDNLERAYLEGFQRACEDEWARIKSQGPVDP